MRLYNTLTRCLEEFKPVKAGEVGMYTCGPTVYWNQHIGHMYCYVHWDTLVRFLRSMDYQVKWVMNITDVGHMVSDEDLGEDKMEKGAKREGLSVWEVAQKYIGQFLESMKALNISRPDILCRATEHINEQIELIKKITASGFAYKTKTGLVFDTGKFPGYGEFARLDLSKQEAGSRVEIDSEKRQPWDFLLWVTNQPSHIMQWDSPWGRGFPGWHIECTAMSTKYLGERFDIHTGGKEHIPVHHTNEIAQAYGAFGRQTANFWLHNEWLTLKGEKMSKSLGNVYCVKDLIEKGFNPLALRYLILTSHYRHGMVFSFAALEAAQKARERLAEIIKGIMGRRGRIGKHEGKEVREFKEEFIKVLGEDLNTPAALALVWKVTKSNLSLEEKLALVLSFDKVLGLGLGLGQKSKIKKSLPTGRQEKSKISEKIRKLVEEREKLRKEKRWEEADRARGEIEKLGLKVEDTATGTKIKTHKVLKYHAA